MSTFSMTGTVTAVENLTSKQGKPFTKFKLTDTEGSQFELSLFGSSMSFAKVTVVGKNIEVKGMLGSREWQGRHYPDFRVQWVEAVEVNSMPPIETKKAEIDFESIPF